MLHSSQSVPSEYLRYIIIQASFPLRKKIIFEAVCKCSAVCLDRGKGICKEEIRN